MLTEMEKLTDMLAGFMYKQADSSDDNTWLESDKFHPVAEQILLWLQSKKLLLPQLNKHDCYAPLPIGNVELLIQGLERIGKWSDEDEDEYDDPGDCAMDTLVKYRYSAAGNCA